MLLLKDLKSFLFFFCLSFSILVGSSKPAIHSVTMLSMNKSKTANKSKSIQPINQLFAEDEDPDQHAFKKAKLTPQAMTEAKRVSEEKKQAVKRLVESIPTDKDELFAYAIDWTQLDQSLMDKRIRPWINKKVFIHLSFYLYLCLCVFLNSYIN